MIDWGKKFHEIDSYLNGINNFMEGLCLSFNTINGIYFNGINNQMGYDSYEEFMSYNPDMKDKIKNKQYRSEYNSQFANSWQIGT